MAELVPPTEEVIEQLEQIGTEVVSARRTLAIGFVAGIICGGATAWFIANRRLQLKYSLIAEEEISTMRQHYRAKTKAREEQEKPALREVIEESGYSGKTVVQGNFGPVGPAEPGSPNVAVDPEPETQNVFEHSRVVSVEEQMEFDRKTAEIMAEKDASEGWDYEVEIANRPADDGVYVIHEDEQHERPGYNEVTLTYYEADDVLAGPDDEIVEDRERIIGNGLDMFGHGSSDPNVVHIRNDAIAADIELCRTSNSYAEDIHGIRHSDETFERFHKGRRHDE